MSEAKPGHSLSSGRDGLGPAQQARSDWRRDLPDATFDAICAFERAAACHRQHPAPERA